MNTEIESERFNKIADLEADIRAIKRANPNWAGDAGALAAIASINQHLAVLEQRGKPSFPISHPVSHDNHLVFILFCDLLCVFVCYL